MAVHSLFLIFLFLNNCRDKTQVMDNFLSKNFVAFLESGDQDSTVLAEIKADIEILKEARVFSKDALINAINDDEVDKDLALKIVWLLGRVVEEEDEIGGALIHATRFQDQRLKVEAINSMGALGNKTCVPKLIEILQTNEAEEVRKSAIYALGLVGDVQVLDLLFIKLHDQNETPSVRSMIAESLSDYYDSSAIKHLIVTLNDKDPRLRFWSAYSLGNLQAKEALPALRNLVKTDNAVIPNYGSVKQEAQEAIVQIEKSIKTDLGQ